MKKYILLIFGLLLSNYSKGQAQNIVNAIDASSVNLSKKQWELITEKLQQFPNNTELSIAIIQKEHPTFVGVKKVNDSLTTCTNHKHVFEIGSISKVFTTTLLANLVLENKVKLEDNIQDYLNFKLAINDTITFKELANHTSGLPRIPTNFSMSILDQNNPYKHYDSIQLTSYLKNEIHLNHPSTTQYQYSNLGVGILGFVLTNITNKSYEDLLQTLIFKKYGMLSSSSQLKNINAPLVSGRNAKGKKTVNWEFDALAGAGAILSTAEDLSKFAIAQFNNLNKELQLTQQPTFKITSKMSKGLGWNILRAQNNAVLWHNGRTGGYTSSIAVDTQNTYGVVILSNLSGFYSKPKSIDNLCFALIQTLY